MSANASNRAVNKRRSQYLKRGKANASLQSPQGLANQVLIQPPSSRLYSPDAVYRLRRNLADCLVSTPSGLVPTAQFMPGFSGTPWVILGSPVTELSPQAGTTYIAQPFALQFSLDALTQYLDIQGFFTEFRVVAVTFHTKTLVGTAGLINVGGAAPEVWQSVWPDDATPPSTIQIQEQRVNRKKLLLGNQELCMTVSPRPAVQMYNSATSSSYVYMSNVDTWASTINGATMPWYSITGVIRNFFAQAGSGLNVRFEAEAFIEFRRPR
jgi:hypothetical protein